MDVYDMCIDTCESAESSTASSSNLSPIPERGILPPISQLPLNSRQQRLHNKYQTQYQLQHRFLKSNINSNSIDNDNDTQEMPILPPLNNTSTTTDDYNHKRLLKQVNEGCTTIFQQIGKYRDAPLRESERNQIIENVYSTAKNMLQLLEELSISSNEDGQDASTESQQQINTDSTTSEEYKLIQQARNLQKNPKPKYRRRSRNTMVGHRCHSCNTTETPEWRRGPDGARTLCNACGLHYAKLVKKGSLTVQTHNYTIEAPPDIKTSQQQRQYTIVQVNNNNNNNNNNETTATSFVQPSQQFAESKIIEVDDSFNMKDLYRTDFEKSSNNKES